MQKEISKLFISEVTHDVIESFRNRCKKEITYTDLALKGIKNNKAFDKERNQWIKEIVLYYNEAVDLDMA